MRRWALPGVPKPAAAFCPREIWPHAAYRNRPEGFRRRIADGLPPHVAAAALRLLTFAGTLVASLSFAVDCSFIVTRMLGFRAGWTTR
jgi:hypothetical protein